jgi:hypothetical protein
LNLVIAERSAVLPLKMRIGAENSTCARFRKRFFILRRAQMPFFSGFARRLGVTEAPTRPWSRRADAAIPGAKSRLSTCSESFLQRSMGARDR